MLKDEVNPLIFNSFLETLNFDINFLKTSKMQMEPFDSKPAQLSIRLAWDTMSRSLIPV